MALADQLALIRRGVVQTIQDAELKQKLIPFLKQLQASASAQP